MTAYVKLLLVINSLVYVKTVKIIIIIEGVVRVWFLWRGRSVVIVAL